MWIVLLDHSSSMGEPFRGTAKFAGRIHVTPEVVKLDAARAKLLLRLAGMGRQPIALFGFTSEARLLFEGTSAQQAEIAGVLDSLRADDGTDVAAALNAAATFIRDREPRIARVLVITDGLSEPEAAKLAAQGLASLGAIVDAVLIDPTAEGESLVRSIIVEGEIEAAIGEQQLTAGIESAAGGYEAFAKQADEIVGTVEAEAAKIKSRVAQEERLACTAAAPAAVTKDIWYPLIVYLHLDSLQDLVLEEMSRQASLRSFAALHLSHSPALGIQRGAKLRLVPGGQDVEFNPRSLSVYWYEDVQEVSFRLRSVPGAQGPILRIWIDIYAEANGKEAIICSPGLALRLFRPGEPIPDGPPQSAKARSFERIFASYSTQDAQLVESMVEAYEALGIYVFLDKNSLRNKAGLEWLPLLKDQIRRSDLLQLYWSKASSSSRYVREEYLYAKSLEGSKGDRFILPVFWEPDRPELPPELSHLQFKRLDPELHRARLSHSDDEPNEPGHEANSAASAPVLATTVPLLPGTDPCLGMGIRVDLSSAVCFLEATTGLRYYPAPTLLVDEHVVRAVRARTTVDRDHLQPSAAQEILLLGDILQALALSVHVRLPNFFPNLDHARREAAIAEASGIGGKGTAALLERCEWIFKPLAREISLCSLDGALGLPERSQGESRAQYLARLLRSAAECVDSSRGNSNSCVPSLQQEHADALKLHLGTVRTKPGTWRTGYVELDGRKEDFARLLDRFREDAALMQAMGTLGTSIVAQGDDLSAHRAAASCIAAICRECCDAKDADVLREVFSALAKPAWIAGRLELAEAGVAEFGEDLDLLRFVEDLLETIQRVLDSLSDRTVDGPVSFGYSIGLNTWDRLQRLLPENALEGEIRPGQFGSEDQVELKGTFQRFRGAFRLAGKEFLNAIGREVHRERELASSVVSRTATYGIYASPSNRDVDETLRCWAMERGIPEELTLPGFPRVLFCLDAYDRLVERLRADRTDNVGLAGVPALLRLSTLVHEHFHAILEVGIDRNGKAARGPAFLTEWSGASNLNEALAAWMEIHFMRDASEVVSEWVKAWVRGGSYPEWPYRGAETVESLYHEKGLSAVQELIESLRADPASAQAAFDAMVTLRGT